MSHLNPGLISAYNSLTDKHLAGYFSNTRIRRHLHRAGLITRSGRIVPDKEYRHKLIQRAHQRHVRECLAQAIFHKVLEMERLHQIEIKRKLEEFARRERVHKIKVERSKRYEEEIRILSPRPPMGARVFRKQHSGPEGDHTESSESPGSSRPNTAPGKMQRPARLEPLHSNSTTASLRPGSPYRLLETANKNEQPFNCTMGKESRRRLTTMDTSQGISPYCLPVINNFVTPVPPATKRKDRGGKPTPSSTLRGRRLRPTTASSGADVSEELPLLRSSVYQSRVCVNMIYFGKTVHLSNDLTDMRDEVKVFQQHCGGENLCVYKGRLREGEMFQFISRRHRGFPFSLTFFLNGLQVERLSSCCEFKHRKGSRLGGRHGHFGFCSVEGASPCYKCIIAMGLDKKPTPPPKRVKDNGKREDSISSPKDATEMETERTAEDATSHSECETRQPRDTETPVQDKTTNLEDKVRDDYEEDFEADDEGPAEDPEEKEKGASSPAAETEVKQKDASESEDNVEDEDARSNSGSSSPGSDKEESEAEAPKAPREDEETGQSKEADQEEAAAPPAEREEANPEEAIATEAESFVAKDSSELLDSAADSTEIDISDASAPSGTENKQSDNTSADKEDQKAEEGSKEEEEQERAKSVQEKLAEAILKESHCSSEPELSDTSTEEEEESTNKGHEQNNEVPEKSEPKCEESIGGEVEEEREETSSAQEPMDDKGEPCESNDGIQEEAVRQEEAEKVSSEVKADAAEQEKTEETEGTDEAPPPESEVEPPEAPQVQDDAAAKVPDVEPAEEDKSGEEQAAVDEAEAKGREEDVSSVSEMNQKADEAAEADAPGQTIIAEMKADHSEEREALCFEEAPEGDTGERREDAPAGLETEVTAENSSSSSEGSGDTAVRAEKTDGTRQDGGKDETHEEEEASGAEASKGESEKQTDDAGEETTERSEGTEVEKVKSEEENKEEEKEIDSNEILGENTEKEQTVQGEEEGSEKITAENEGNDNKTDLNIEEKSKTDALQEEIPNGETEDREEKEKTESAVREDDEVNKQVTNEDAEEESEEKEAERNEEELNTIDDKQTGEAEEMEEKDAGNKDEVSEHEKIDKEEENIISEEPEEGGEKSEVAEGTMKRDEGDNDVLKMSDENTESEVATEAAGRSSATEETLKKESMKESHEAERGEVDAENGEMSTTLESKSTRPETPAEEKNDQAGEKETDKENVGATTEELVESADTTEKENLGITTPTAEEGIDAEEGDAIVEKQDESNKRETSSPEVREKSDSAENKDQEDDEKKENIEPEVSEEVSPEEHVRPSAATEPGDALHDEEAESDKRAEEQPAGVEASAADGENGAGTEDASKASEEGASVLLKPQAQPTALGIAGGAQTPETLEKENSADLVTNWVTLHQTSKYFETFVEPLEELKGSERRGSANGSEGDAVDSKQGGATHTEEAGEEAHEKDAQEAKNASTDADDEPCVVDPVMELTEETGESKAVKEETQSPKDIGENEMVRIEVESIPGTNHSGASGKPQSIVEEKPTEEGQEYDQKPPQETEGPTSPESGEHRESPVGPSKPTDATPEYENNSRETQEVTEVTEFAKSDVGSQQETNSGGPELRPTTDGSVDGDKRGAQLIHEIGHTISKERLSTFSVDETLFGRASYPLLTAAARTESGH